MKAASRGVLRRVVPSAVVLGVLSFSTAAALLALAVLTSANQGFYTAFSGQHEAQLAVTINSAKVTAGQVARTRHLPGVTQTAGPYPQTTITATGGAAAGGGPGSSMTFTVAGRSSPNGALHRIAWNSSLMCPHPCRWPSASGEISISQSTQIRVPLGATITVTSAPGRPKLTVVGYGTSTVLYDGGWVVPGEIPRLRAKGAPAQEVMYYDFTSAGTSAQIGADLAELKRALPAGVIASSQSWLPSEQQTATAQAMNTPFITAFAVIALVLSVLIVASVVAAAVVASYRRIGVLKSIGFTPGQVTGVYLAQIGLPAVAGAVIGAVLGNHWALPLIKMAPIPVAVAVPAWIDLTASPGMLALTALAAAVPALRAGRMPAVQAIAAGQAPAARRGYQPHRLAGQLPLPRPVTAGLAAPFSRPARSAVMLLSITAGLMAVVMATGLDQSIHKINRSAIQGLGQVQIQPRGLRGAPFTRGQEAAVVAAIRSQPGTRHYVAESDSAAGVMARSASSGVVVPNRTQLVQPPPGTVVIHIRGPLNPLSVIAYDGDPSWLGWALVAGHWYHGDEIDATPDVLAGIHKKAGQKITMTVNGRHVTAQIAGEVFVPGPPALFVSWQTLGPAAAAKLAVNVTSYDINLRPGTRTSAYISALTRKLGTSSYFIVTPAGPSIAAQINSSYFQLLAVLIAVLAALGVLNSALMAARERVHDIGVFKALGMTPSQTVVMILCWVIVPTIIAAIIAVPAGLIVQDKLIRHLAAATTRQILPGSFVHVLGAGELALLTLAGLAIAVAGALGPAGWAATSRTTTTLRAE